MSFTDFITAIPANFKAASTEISANLWTYSIGTTGLTILGLLGLFFVSITSAEVRKWLAFALGKVQQVSSQFTGTTTQLPARVYYARKRKGSK